MLGRCFAEVAAGRDALSFFRQACEISPGRCSPMVRRETAPEIGIRQKEPVPGQKKALRDDSSKRLSITNRIEKVFKYEKYEKYIR